MNITFVITLHKVLNVSRGIYYAKYYGGDGLWGKKLKMKILGEKSKREKEKGEKLKIQKGMGEGHKKHLFGF